MPYIEFMCPDTPLPGFLSRVLQHTWTDLPSFVAGEDAAPLSRQQAKLWALVLASRHVPHRMHRLPESKGGGYTIQVQQWFAERAAREIVLYHDENQPEWQSVNLVDLRPVSGLEPTLFGLGLLILFFWFYSHTFPGFGLYPGLWVKVGSANGSAILGGEWFRLATALTLHADGPHVAGNAVIGGVFIWLVSRRLGAGLAWFLTIWAGVLGNLVNILVLGVHHDAIGFSTATFGAAGVLAAITPFGVGGGMHGRGEGHFVRRAFQFARTGVVPFGAGLGLLAMLGAGKETDLGAHLFGFLAGVGLGGVAGFFTTRMGLPGRQADTVLYLAGLFVPAMAWVWAWVA